jgi:heptosyltransferase-2
VTVLRRLADLVYRAGDRLWQRQRTRRAAELAAGPLIRRILVFNPVAGLGNMVLLSGLLVNLRRLYPGAQIAVAMPASPLAAVVLSRELADEVLPFDPAHDTRLGLLRFAWRELRPRRFDLGLGTFFSATTLTSVMLAAAGCRYRIAYGQATHRGFLNAITLIDAGGHELDRHLRLLDFTQQLRERRTAIALSAQAVAAAHDFLAQYDLGGGRPLLGIHPGCDRLSALKRWPAERFAAVVRQLVGDGRADVLVFIGPDDMDAYDSLAPLASAHVHVISGAPFDRVAALIGACRVFLSNDSGLMHVAAALDVPVVAIFGPTDTVKNAPVGNAIVLSAHDVPCRPCYVAPPITCRYDRRYCLEAISVGEVIDNLRHILVRRSLAEDLASAGAGYVT